MGKILAAAILSAFLGASFLCAPAAHASGWVPDPHYGFSVVHVFTANLNPNDPSTDDPPNNDDPPAPTDVPEPATFALFGAGLLGCVIALDRRRRSNLRSREHSTH